MTEHFFLCPYCFESVSVLIDTSVYRQTYIEDCEVCCNPIEIKVTTTEGEIVEFETQSIDQ